MNQRPSLPNPLLIEETNFPALPNSNNCHSQRSGRSKVRNVQRDLLQPSRESLQSMNPWNPSHPGTLGVGSLRGTVPVVSEVPRRRYPTLHLPDISAISLKESSFPPLGAAVKFTPVEADPTRLVALIPEKPARPFTRPQEITMDGIYRYGDAIPKSQQGTTLDFRILLAQSEKEKKRTPILEVGDTSRKDGGGRTTAFVGPGGNVLDSTAPTKLRGKESEKPKPKKPSALKKAINEARMERKHCRDAAAAGGIPRVNGASAAVNEGGPPEDDCDLAKETSADVIPSPHVKDVLHTKHFRPYCDQILRPEINVLIGKILDILVYYQDRSFHQQDPTKFKRRFVCGLKDVAKKLLVHEVKLVIFAPDVESADQPKGLDGLVSKIRNSAEEQNVPVVFGMKRWVLGMKCRKPNPVSCIGILSYDVASSEVKQLLELVKDAREEYIARSAILQTKILAPNTENLQVVHEDVQTT